MIITVRESNTAILPDGRPDHLSGCDAELALRGIVSWVPDQSRCGRRDTLLIHQRWPGLPLLLSFVWHAATERRVLRRITEEQSAVEDAALHPWVAGARFHPLTDAVTVVGTTPTSHSSPYLAQA